MSDYSKLTDFAAKDALITGNPAKLIKGTEHDAEYNAIATAIATKFDSSDIASESDITTGTSNTKLVTPARLTFALASFDPGTAMDFFNKDATTSRNSVTVVASDPDLITASLATGTYIIEVFGAFRCNGGSQGYAFALGGSATIRASSPQDNYASIAHMAGNSGAVTMDAGYPTVGFAKVTGTTSINPFHFKAKIVVTGAGTVAFQWAQASSSATATELLAGATMTVEQVA